MIHCLQTTFRFALLTSVMTTALGLASPASAQSNVNIFGSINLAVIKESGTPARLDRGYFNWLGFAGSEVLAPGLAATFNLTTRFLPDTGQLEAPSTFWYGESTVGLKSTTFGALRLGRALTPLWALKYRYEPWGDSWLVGSLARYQTTSRYLTNPAGCVSDCPGAARLNNGVFYDSPTLAGFDAHVGVQVEREINAARRGAGASINYAAGPLSAMLSWEQNTANGSILFAGAAYTFGSASLMGSVSEGKQSGTPNQKAAVIAGTYSLTASDLLRTGYGKDFETKEDKLSLGILHSFSKRTAIYADVWREKLVTHANGIGVGMQHSF